MPVIVWCVYVLRVGLSCTGPATEDTRSWCPYYCSTKPTSTVRWAPILQRYCPSKSDFHLMVAAESLLLAAISVRRGDPLINPLLKLIWVGDWCDNLLVNQWAEAKWAFFNVCVCTTTSLFTWSVLLGVIGFREPKSRTSFRLLYVLVSFLSKTEQQQQLPLVFDLCYMDWKHQN